MENTIGNILLDNYFIPIYGIALFISVVRYRMYFDTVLKYFPILIAYTFFNELLGVIIKNIADFQFVYIKQFSYYNVILYNIYSFIFYLFFYYVYWERLTNPKEKKLIKIGALMLVATNLVSVVFQDPMLVSLYVAYSVGAIFLLIAIFFYLRQIKAGIQNFKQLRGNLLFWISLGLFVFFLIDPVVMIIGTHYDYVYLTYNLQQLLYVLIVTMYSFFILGFILCRRRGIQ